MEEELRHRGEPVVEYPAGNLLATLGGAAGVEALIADLYRRMEADELLRVAFRHFNHLPAAQFFVQWFGGDRGYSDRLVGGLLRRHHHRYVSPRTAAAWLRCMREALEARGVPAEPILRPLARAAKALVHSPETPDGALDRACAGVLDPGQVRLEALLVDAARGQTDAVREVLAGDPELARRRGPEGTTVAWVATYRNRPAILTLALEAGGDPNAPACDPPEATMACDAVSFGTGVSVTPLALARRWKPALAQPLLAHGARDDVFTAAWLGDVDSLGRHLAGNPRLVDAIDPAEDYQEVTPLAHAIAGGSLPCATLLIERGAEVRRHSGKVLELAVLLDRVDLVHLLIEHGADVQRVDGLGKLDDAERPVADLLVAHGKRVPRWMLARACRPDVSRNELHRVQVLLAYGASVDDRGQYGLTALHYAVRGGKLPLIQLLLDRGADPDALDDEGLTPLVHLGRTRSKLDPVAVLERLVARGANLDARDDRQATLLMHFARKGQSEPVRWLLAHGADRRLRNADGRTAADLAARHPATARLLAG